MADVCSYCPEGYPDEWGHHPACPNWANGYFCPPPASDFEIVHAHTMCIKRTNTFYEVLVALEIVAIIALLVLLTSGL